MEILRNTLHLSEKTANDIADSTRQPYMLHEDTQLDMETMNDILKSGCTAVPIYNDVPDCKKPSIVGVLHTKVHNSTTNISSSALLIILCFPVINSSQCERQDSFEQVES